MGEFSVTLARFAVHRGRGETFLLPPGGSFLSPFPWVGRRTQLFLGHPPCMVWAVGYIGWFAWSDRPASVAQLAEQLICNQQVVGSSPSASLLRAEQGEQTPLECRTFREQPAEVYVLDGPIRSGGFPERSKGSDCKSDGNAFTGSNPVPPTPIKLHQ